MYDWMTAETLRTQRTRRQITQAALADRLGVAANTVARWERGELTMSKASRRAVVAALWPVGAQYTDGQKYYRLSAVSNHTPNTLAFRRTRKSDGHIIGAPRSEVVNVNMGSRNLPAQKIDWLLSLTPITTGGVTVNITNDFHGTSCTLRVPRAACWLTATQVARCRKTLCGIEGCTCGGDLGERGRQSVAVADANYDARGRLVVRIEPR